MNQNKDASGGTRTTIVKSALNLPDGINANIEDKDANIFTL
jgi:hypothetical protein